MADRHCTTRRRNTHRTDKLEERQVLYRWHPWTGCVVHVHEVIGKVSGKVLRCSRKTCPAGPWLEVPVWMFDRTACLAMQLAACPRVDVAALSALGALLAQTAGHGPGRQPSSNAPVSSAARECCGRNRGDAHARPAPPSREPSQPSPTTRSVRASARGVLRSADAGMAQAPRTDASGRDGPHGAAHPRTRTHRSRSGPNGGGR